ncbi:MAG: hypothetical protein WBD47_02400 [Phormidesmis sp.]
MKPVSSASDDDDLQRDQSEGLAVSFSGQVSGPNAGQPSGSLESLQQRYDEQLSQDIKRLEAKKDQLQTDISVLQADYERLRSNVRLLRGSAEIAEYETFAVSGPRLPGEPAPVSAPTSSDRSIELPIPATSEQPRLTSAQSTLAARQREANVRKGLILSAIATGLMAWHYCLVSSLGQGGSWWSLSIGQLGIGMVPAVALLWFRMLVIIPVLVILAPQLYRNTWDDLQDWIYNRNWLLVLLMGSGAALFASQVLIYQCIGTIGPVLGATVLFMYPLSAVPMGLFSARGPRLTSLGVVAMVAIAMGSILVIKPLLNPALDPEATRAICLGILASVAFSLYIVLTNISYRQQCHPIPTSIVQFATVAVLSSLVLLVKPLGLANISWISFSAWGLLLGIALLLVYLFTYSSLRLIGPMTTVVAAATPLVTVLIAWSFTPRPPLEIIQWTGVMLVTVGGIALGKEKLESKSLG